MRDVILNQPVFWVVSPTDVLVAIGAAIATVILVSTRVRRRVRMRWIQIPDAIGLAFFAVSGTAKAISLAVNPAVAVIMGVMTGVFGGVIRDVLAGEVPTILKGDIYASAALLSAIAYVALNVVTGSPSLSTGVAILAGVGLRLAALRWNLQLPVFHAKS